MNVADFTIDFLLANGIDKIFGVGGGSVEPIHDALHHREDRARFVLTRHETAACFMAEAYWRFSGKAAGVLTTSGAGIFNAFNGMAEAFMSRAPLLSVTGSIPRGAEASSIFQNTSGLGGSPDLLRAFEPITVFCRRVDRVEDLPQVLEEAIVAMHGPRRGPALVILPKDVQMAPCAFTPNKVILPSIPESGDPAAVVAAIREAHRPLLVVGEGVKRHHARAAITDLSSRLNIPVASAPIGKDCFPNDHPNYLGPMGIFGIPRANRYAQSADLLIFVGATEEPWSCYSIPLGDKRRVSILEGDAGYAPSPIHMGGDIKEALGRVMEALPGHRNLPVTAELAGERAECDLLALDHLNVNSGTRLIGELLPHEVNCMFECGLVAAAGVHFVKVPGDAQMELSLATASMGYAVSGIVGAAVARPDRDSVVLTSDGSVLMNGSEIHTAVSAQLDILFVIFNNNSHGIGIKAQEIFYEGRTHGTSYAPLDCVKLAEAYGVPYVDRISEVDEARPKLQRALAARGVRVVEIVIRKDACPPILTFLQKAVGAPPTEVFG